MTVLNAGWAEIPLGKIYNALLKEIKNGKCPGGDIPLKTLKTLYKCMKQGKVPTKWKNAEVTLLLKKWENSDIQHYRPICLLSRIYKLFTKIITNRLTIKLDSYQTVGQAGFKKG